MTCACGHAEAAHRHHRRHAAYCGHEGCACNRRTASAWLRTWWPVVIVAVLALAMIVIGALGMEGAL